MSALLPSSGRRVLPEVLDGLDADDPRGRRSRRDLERIHVAMRTVSILRGAVTELRLAAQPKRILETGAGDGTLLLRLARALRPRWTDVELTLLDRIDLVAESTRAAYRELGWRITTLRVDVLDWTATARPRTYDLCFANLFLHHFDSPALRDVLAAIAASSAAFVACEPRRSASAHWGSRLVGFLGANDVTREDAVTSVAAGFRGRELSALWPTTADCWATREFGAGPFSHCFTAVRADAQARGGGHDDR